MVAILLSRPPHYGCALIILQICVMCFAICLVTSWKNDLNYSEKEPSEYYIILSRPSKIVFPQKPIVWCVGWIDKFCSRCTIWCTIFLIKSFEVHVFLLCTHTPKVLTRHTKNETSYNGRMLEGTLLLVCRCINFESSHEIW